MNGSAYNNMHYINDFVVPELCGVQECWAYTLAGSYMVIQAVSLTIFGYFIYLAVKKYIEYKKSKEYYKTIVNSMYGKMNETRRKKK